MLEPPLQANPATVLLFLPAETTPSAPATEGRGLTFRPQNSTRSVAGLTAQQAAQTRQAMFICTLERVALAFSTQSDVDLALCVDIDAVFRESRLLQNQSPTSDKDGRYTIRRDDAAPGTLDFLPPEAAGWDVFPQGPGTHGERLALAWQVLGCGRVIFLGIDTPDVPLDSLRGIIPQLDAVDFVLGKSQTQHPGSGEPSAGCWALAANRYHPGLLEGIDWRAGNVYHQALRAAQRANLTHAQLPDWPAADPAAGLTNLLNRLEPPSDPPLARLRERLLAIVGEL